jgi:hypothetical protein
MDHWQKILWREWFHCGDEDYQERLYRFVDDISIDWRTRRKNRPLAMEVEIALHKISQTSPRHYNLWLELLNLLEEKRQSSISATQLIAELDNSEWVVRFLARHILLTLGGEAIIPLKEIAANQLHPSQQTALWLLASIEQETLYRLSGHIASILCPTCWVRPGSHSIKIATAIEFTYYGCRMCGQSRDFVKVNRVMAVLHKDWSEIKQHKDEQMRINWFKHQKPFDFDDVEIIQATDHDVERFAIQVGNDLDPFRKSSYRKMICSIEPTCLLSENTIRILKHLFGQVQYLVESRNVQ